MNDSPPKGLVTERLKALSKGTKIVLAAGLLLFLDLFFTWQRLEIDFGPAGRALAALDGWDFWGLLIGLLTLALVSLVVVVHATDVEVSPDVPWDLVALGLAALIFVLTLVKNLTDASSSWASYVGVALAGLVVVGAYLERAQARSDQASEPAAESDTLSRAV